MRTLLKLPPSHQASRLHQRSSRFRNLGYRPSSRGRRSICSTSLSGCSWSHGTCRRGRKVSSEPGWRSSRSRQLFWRPGQTLSLHQYKVKLIIMKSLNCFGERRRMVILSNLLFKHKVDRCLARYSPHAEANNAISCNTVWYNTIPYDTMQYHTIQCNNMQNVLR